MAHVARGIGGLNSQSQTDDEHVFCFLWKYLQDPIAYQGRILAMVKVGISR